MNKHQRLRFLPLDMLLLACLSLPASQTADAADTTTDAPRPQWWAQPVALEGVPNLHRISGRLYRSAQPTTSGFQALETLGIHTVLNLRQYHDDDDEAAGTQLVLKHRWVNTGDFGDTEMLDALQTIATAREPVLVHCWHGADRTGTVIALYRMVCQGWNREQALDELQHGGYGYHAMFDNIPAYLRQVDVGKLRRQVNGENCPRAAKAAPG